LRSTLLRITRLGANKADRALAPKLTAAPIKTLVIKKSGGENRLMNQTVNIFIFYCQTQGKPSIKDIYILNLFNP
jgi:hypothetical protein